MALNGKVRTTEETRYQKREKERANDYLNELLQKYIDYKNRNHEERGAEIMLYPGVFEIYDILNQMWVSFACNNSKNPKRTYKFDTKAFAQAVEKHLAKHREICWVNYVYRTCHEKLNCYPSLNSVKEKYSPEADADKKAVEIKFDLINFLMNTLEIQGINHFKTYAGKVSELTPDQFLYYIELYLQFKAELITLADVKTLLFLKLADIKYSSRYEYLRRMESKLPAAREEKMRIDSNIHLLSETLNDFVIDAQDPDGKPYKDFSMEFINNLIPKIKVRFLKLFKKTLYGPADGLTNCNFYEYRTAHDYFIKYSETKDNDILCKMVATLYRPKKSFLFIRKYLKGYNGEERKSINSKTNPRYLESRAKKIAALPVQFRLGVYFFFKNCEEFLRYGKPVINNNEIDLSILYESDSDIVSTGPDIGLTGVLFSLAETGVFGAIDKTDEQNLYDVMARLYQVCKENKDAKATNEKINKNH